MIPNKHLMIFNQYKDAKTLFAAIQTRFGGFGRLNKPDLDTMSFDDLYNNFKIVEQEVKGTTSPSSSLSSHNMAFVSSPSSTNEVNIAYVVSTANTQVSLASTQVSTTNTQVSTANLSDATVYAFLANQPNGSQLVHEDLEQIHEDDLEEMDFKWQLALLSMRTRRRPRNPDSRNRNQDSSRWTVNVEETSSKAMLAIDGAGLHKDGDADASFHFRNSDKYYHDPEECEPHCILLQDLIAFCFKTSLRFASRPHYVLLQDLIAFCFKLSLRFASTSLRFAKELHCVLLEDHIAF
ncbi:hypothetical protein Tco_1165613 [Tanacetum coccineum]